MLPQLQRHLINVEGFDGVYVLSGAMEVIIAAMLSKRE